MSNLTQLRIAAREILDETLWAVDPAAAIKRELRREGSSLHIGERIFDLKERNVYSMAIGKAAVAMASALEDQIGETFAQGLVVGPIVGHPRGRELAMPPRKFSTRWQWRQGGHPLPNSASLTAASEAFALLDRANQEHGLLVFLISGGGSAMIEWPISRDISLAHLRTANQVLINSGASISEINSVRRAFSAIKGGRLATHALNCEQITLIISDVPRGEEANVASGSTITAPRDAPDACEVIERFNLGPKLPPSIVRALEKAELEPLKAEPASSYQVLLDNHDALLAAAEAARRRGFMTEIAFDIADQNIDDGCGLWLERVDAMRKQHRSERPFCLVSGGEFACPVKGAGVGGRNLETALRLAILNRLPANTAAVCAGTDGIDGNSPAAGAIVDSTTLVRARAIGLDANESLRRSDSYSFFVALGDAINTGPTGTNVRDVRILLSAA